ncbi:hypothetical protein [Fulvivirga sedimenti]|uniref:Uncharacterized protein n=1 Tax=Fulvivirga sedimenti TaxID=2879465 RepID=A0A9X1L057_9BACT|nr:hypothetical protein [Fulvivirga sedimenti]MCA6075279.1 hypothetical protein [Fulvivirga sedimenti]MCA6076456.1 hypothetical protein [Fulvivirga sedimenti]MCA6077584.1 hypothetical protein [Fulvivirga sedimenti]
MNKSTILTFLISLSLVLSFVTPPILSVVYSEDSACYHLPADDHQPAGDQHENECEDGKDFYAYSPGLTDGITLQENNNIPELLNPYLSMVHSDVFTPPPERGSDT